MVTKGNGKQGTSCWQNPVYSKTTNCTVIELCMNFQLKRKYVKQYPPKIHLEYQSNSLYGPDLQAVHLDKSNSFGEAH